VARNLQATCGSSLLVAEDNHPATNCNPFNRLHQHHSFQLGMGQHMADPTDTRRRACAQRHSTLTTTTTTTGAARGLWLQCKRGTCLRQGSAGLQRGMCMLGLAAACSTYALATTRAIGIGIPIPIPTLAMRHQQHTKGSSIAAALAASTCKLAVPHTARHNRRRHASSIYAAQAGFAAAAVPDDHCPLTHQVHAVQYCPHTQPADWPQGHGACSLHALMLLFIVAAWQWGRRHHTSGAAAATANNGGSSTES
jgi:hypothetical protein